MMPSRTSTFLKPAKRASKAAGAPRGSRILRRQLGALFVAIAVTCASWSAVADEKEQARQLFDAGLKLMRMDDFGGATADFERSVALYPTQNSLFNLANCYKAVQRYTDALDVLARLRRQFGDKLKPELKEAADRQEQEIQSLVARLTIQTVPSDAKVKVDGRELGTGPTLGPLMLGPGDHQIEASRLGYQDLRRSVQLVSGAEVTETFNLVAEPGQVAIRADGASVPVDGKEVGKTPSARAVDAQVIVSAPADASRAQPAPADLGLATAVAPAPEAQPRSRAAKIVMWSSLAGAVAAGIVAGVYWKIADNRYQTYQSLNAEFKDQGVTKVKSDRDAVGNEVMRDSGIALGFGIGAGALAVTALVAYLIDGSDKGTAHARVSLSGTGVNVSF